MKPKGREPFERRRLMFFNLEVYFYDTAIPQYKSGVELFIGIIERFRGSVVAVGRPPITFPEFHFGFAEQHACGPGSLDHVVRLVSEQQDIDLGPKRFPAFFFHLGMRAGGDSASYGHTDADTQTDAQKTQYQQGV